MCDKTAALLQSGDGLTLLGELTAEPFPWVSTKWPRSLQEEQGEGESKSGMEMTDDRARVEGRRERMYEGRQRWGLWRGWGLKRRNEQTGGEERRSDGGAIIIGYENLAVTSAPLLAWRYLALLHLLSPPGEPLLFFLRDTF